MKFIKYLTILCCLLFAGGTIKAQDTHWTYDANAFEYDMTAYLTIESGDNVVDDLSDYEVAAFVGAECRGVSRLIKTEQGNTYLYMRIRSNQEQGESIAFKVYQKSKDKEMECDETVVFENRSVIGMPSSPINVKLKVATFTVTIETSGKGTVTGAGTYNEGETISLTAVPEEGWHFVKWSDGTTSSTYSLTINGDKSLTAEFARNSYVVKFVVDGVTISEQTVEYEAKIEIPTVPEKVGYTFTGWDKEIPATMPAENMEFTAQWTINSYKLIYKVDNAEYKSYEVEYGKAIEKEAEPTRTGYTFSGWSEIPETMPAHDVEVSGSFTVNTYTLTFNSNGGSEVAPITQDYGTDITAPADPTREGYTFAGWDKEIPATMPAENLEFTAQWTINSYKLIYKVDNVEYKSYEVEYCKAIEKEAEPTRTGYTFSGWSEIPETMPAHDVEVNGSFTVNTYTLTFNSNGGSEVAPIVLNYGSAITAPADPTREGYTFAGWDKDIPETMPAENMEFTAQWTINSYKLIYKVDNVEYKFYEVEYGKAIEKEAEPTRTGYTFSGWSEIPETMPAHDVEVNGSFTVNTYTLTFNSNGGSEVAPIVLGYGSAITAPADPTREGYTFAGWDKKIPETMPAENMEFTAQWTINSYKVIYKVDNVEYKSYEVEYGKAIEKEAEPTRTGYTFSGWSEIPETMPAHDVEVNGSFTVNTYTLTFNSNGGSEVAPIVLNYGSAITAPADPTREGYTFAGWDKEIPETMPAENMEFTAQWTINSYKVIYKVDNVEYKSYEVEYGKAIEKEAEPTRTGYTFSGWSDIPETMPAHDVEINGSFVVNQYTITFDTDGGSEIDPITQDYGTDVIAPEDPTREGYTFAGWDMDIPETMPAEDLELTAQWTVNSYKLTYYVDGEVYKEYEVEYGTAIVPEEEPVKDGYKFSGWSEIIEEMPAHDVAIYGTFEIETGITHILGDVENVDIYDINGKMLLHGVSVKDIREKLGYGLYIINGKKVMIK